MPKGQKSPTPDLQQPPTPSLVQSENLTRGQGAWAARYAAQAMNTPGATVNIGSAVAGALLPNVSRTWLRSYFRSNTATIEGRVGSTGEYHLPGTDVPGQTAGGFINPSAIRVTGGSIPSLSGNLLHELYHGFQRQLSHSVSGPLFVRELAAGLTGQDRDWIGEPTAHRIAGQTQVAPGGTTRLRDLPPWEWQLYRGFLNW